MEKRPPHYTRIFCAVFTCALLVADASGALPIPSPSSSSGSSGQPAIQSLVQAKQYKKILDDREILANASLGDEDEAKIRRYQFYSAMVAHAGLETTRKILTDYSLYSKLVPYIDRTSYDSDSRTLEILGGIWKFKLHSWIRFEERGNRWIHWRIVRGHFTGLEGDMLFESAGEKGTAIYLRGAVSGTVFPPKFVIERGAEIVFGFTARRMRSYIEQTAQNPEIRPNESPNPTEVPQPRRRL